MNPAQITSYWSEANRLITIASKYGQKIALKANLLDDSTAWKVEGVLKSHYGGSMETLEHSIYSAERMFKIEVKNFNTGCRNLGVTEIKDPDKLLALLTDSSRRDFYRKAIKKAMKSQTVFRLQDIELSYKGSSK